MNLETVLENMFIFLLVEMESSSFWSLKKLSFFIKYIAIGNLVLIK